MLAVFLNLLLLWYFRKSNQILSFVFDLLNQPYLKFLYQLYFIRLMVFYNFKRVSNFRFLMQVSLFQWCGEIGIFSGKFQFFFTSSTCCSVAATPYASIFYKFCFTKLLTLILILFLSGTLLSSHKKINDNHDQTIHQKCYIFSYYMELA